MANINRDYLIVLDAKSSVISEADELKYYITDEHSQNLFVNLVVRDIERINKYVEVHDPEKYQLELHIVKPNNDIVRPHLQANLLSAQDAIYVFELPKEATDYIGTYKCELRVTYKETDETTITTSNKFKYKVKRSIYNDLDSIQEAPQYPVVIQLFDKLSDINQYEEDRRADELARQVAEQQRQTRFDALDAAMVDNIQEMDDKVVEVENRITTKEQAVDKLIVDTKKDIDDYKVAKDTEIDEYKTAKDQQIDQAITNQNNKIDDAIANQNNKIDTAISNQNDRIAVVENNDAVQDNRLNTVEAKNQQQDDRLDVIEAKNTQQDGRLDVVENKNQQQDNRLDVVEAKNVEQDNRLDAIEAIDVAQNNRLDAIEAKNQQQDDRLLDIEKVNKRQDMDLKMLFAESKNNMIDVTEEGNSIYLQNSTVGYTLIDEIQGNTLVNCNKEPDKEITLNGNINTQGYSNVTLTEGVDGGLVDVALEGNTMVNVCDQKYPVAITKSYTVETGNHIALQGEYDGKCRPIITGNTLVNIIQSYSKGDNTVMLRHGGLLKTNTTYTLIAPAFDSNVNVMYVGYNGNDVLVNYQSSNIVSFNTGDSILSNFIYCYYKGDDSVAYINNVPFKYIILEGDYTDKQIPDYFEGLQSSFEDNLVTQEMVDNGEELAENLGKYRVDYKTTGKNLFDEEFEQGSGKGSNSIGMHYTQYQSDNNTRCRSKNLIDVIPNTQYTVSYSDKVYQIAYWEIDKNGIVTKDSGWMGYNTGKVTFNTKPTTRYLKFVLERRGVTMTPSDILMDIQLEEGDTATTYEPYKEYKKTFYLNSPLLEGDTIEQQGNNVVHVHRSELRAYETDDELTLPTDKTNTLVAKATPQYEVISQNDSILCDSYVNGHLDVDSIVPIEKVVFNNTPPFILKYLYQNTSYIVQFESDNTGKVDAIRLGDALIRDINIVKGINKFTVTTADLSSFNNALYINGIGFNASNIVVTQATDQDFGYFEGMKSVGECEDLAVVSSNSDGTLSNTQTLTHEPLRAIGDVKDKYVLIDGKWYIERKCGVRAYQDGDKDNYITDMVNTVYPLQTPTYEPIGYNPFKVYSDITHISNNSTIPANMVIKNTGYNCLLKPSTTYTVSSNLGLNTVTTPSTLTEDCLRFYDTDTSTVTTMKNVLVLEGDYTTGKPLPSHFSGIESCFEQEYDEAVGKYKVKIRVQNEDASKENYIEFYINEPLRGIGTVKDKVYVKDGKVVVERNCGSVILDGNRNWGEFVDVNSTLSRVIGFFTEVPDIEYRNATKNILCDGLPAYVYDEKNTEGCKLGRSSHIHIYVSRAKLQTQDKTGFIQWLQQNPTTVVYQLAEPTYEEVDYNDVKLFIESFKNSTLFYNSNVPVTSKLYYSYSVPIVDKVSQTASISDEQDVMIIDLATEVAVMEMMLM